MDIDFNDPDADRPAVPAMRLQNRKRRRRPHWPSHPLGCAVDAGYSARAIRAARERVPAARQTYPAEDESTTKP
jgi:hypothetical protein